MIFLNTYTVKNVILIRGYGELSATCSTCTKFQKFIRLHLSCHTDNIIVFSCFRSEKRRVASSCLLVLPYARIRTTPNGRIFMKFCLLFTKTYKKFQIFG